MLDLKSALAKSKETSPEEYFIKVHYLLCRKFGWIPVEEFKRIPIPMVFDLMECIVEEAKEDAKAFKK